MGENIEVNDKRFKTSAVVIAFNVYILRRSWIQGVMEFNVSGSDIGIQRFSEFNEYWIAISGKWACL